jgi:hypothetical protein
MAGCLKWLVLGFTPVGEDPAMQLAMDALVGAAIFIAVLSAAWWIAGRPPGAERDLLTVLGRLGRRLA